MKSNGNMQLERIEISKLKSAEYNPRKALKPGDPEFEKLKNSITEFGYVEPIIWNKRTGKVVGGHQRLSVLKHLGETEVDCVVVDLDEQKEKALNIALNKISGDWDMPLLTDLLKDLNDDGFDITLTGFDMSEFDSFFKDEVKEQVAEDDDFDLSKQLKNITKVRTQKGDIWQIGKHRLMCGDSTKEGDVAQLLGGKKATVVFTDPPWNVDYGGASHPSWKQRSIMNDSMSTEQFGVFLTKAFDCMSKVIVDGAMVYVVMSGQEWGNIMNVMDKCGYHWSSTIIWAKDTLVLSRKDYHTQYEPIWYGWKNGTRVCPLEDRKQSDVWNIPRPKRSEEHPTMKPIELVARALMNSSHSNEIALDLFGGSGTTLMAAEQTNRVCCMMELDPKYCDVIVQRYINLFNKEDDIFLIRDGKKIPYKDVK